ncbi:hypothetical protein CFC21_059433 [Triticum aestivum]|uniref:Bifunctional inhibitor/plant lipid transfer protein/seed storage helical domain-containing protein n=3 Tax=Triticum TaxID=4564 RepID=A0A9R0WHR8_TRITD|nr:non-specific lipid-transfer protein A-like [Triticum aestivum]KAF7051163.1 hypothetical protein CFC21_059433 [Triticum aestivum]VAI10826.1 unnamed protein product [Triticum turgidum subsp. durum]
MAAVGWFLAAGAIVMATLLSGSALLTAPAAGMPTPTPPSSSSLDCGTVTSLLTGCAAFVTGGTSAAPLPAPGTPCCEGVDGLYAVAADSPDNWRSVCRCMAGLVRRYWSNASAIALLPGLCGVSPVSTAHAVTYCTSIP